ncbi:hypothetical protein [Labrenzia sp. DG1229]|uniref:hypothetical protein n=1 Tax=Labrenzia sp. DG1229 TaxID=681847 RepID=UPI000A78BC5A|nr:hypothetical protein [Labrenzia sp. DG1229]
MSTLPGGRPEYKKRRIDRGVFPIDLQLLGYFATSRIGVAVPTLDVVLVFAH